MMIAMADLKAVFNGVAGQSCCFSASHQLRKTFSPAPVSGIARNAPSNGLAAHIKYRPLLTLQQQEAEKLLPQYCSFPEVRRHPRHTILEAQSRAWLSDLFANRLPSAFVQRLLDTRLETLACVFYPMGSISDTRSLTLIKLIHWIVILDDVMDDARLLGHNYEAARRFAWRQFRSMFGHHVQEAQAAGLLGAKGYDATDEDVYDTNHIGLAAPSSGIATGGALSASDDDADAEQKQAASVAMAQQELVIEMGIQWASEMQAQGLSNRQIERLREAVAEYLASLVSVVRLRQEKRLPSLEEYMDIRRRDGAEKLTFLGCEFDLGIELDDATLQHPLVKALHAATANNILWINDLLSFNRECNMNDYVSLLPVLYYDSVKKRMSPKLEGDIPTHAHHQPPPLTDIEDTDFQEVLAEARRMIKACDQERVRLADEIASWRPDLQLYVKATHYAIAGFIFWNLWSSRYQTSGPM